MVKRQHDIEVSRLGKLVKLGEGGQGRVYRLLSTEARDSPSAYKEYDPATLATLDEEIIRRIVDLPDSLPVLDRELLRTRTAWPTTLVYRDGRICGLLMDQAPDRFYRDIKLPGKDAVLCQVQYLLNSDSYLGARGLRISGAFRLGLLRDIAETLSILHRNRIAIGDLSPKNLLFAFFHPRCFLIDCDAVAVEGRSALPPSETPEWDVASVSNEPPATQESDIYKLGLLSVRLFARDQLTRDIAKATGLPGELAVLAGQSLRADPADRPASAEWLTTLDRLITTGRPLRVAGELGVESRASASPPVGYDGAEPRLVLRSPGKRRTWGKAHLDGHTNAVRLARWSSDGSYLATFSDVRLGTAVCIWDATNGALLSVLDNAKQVSSVAWSPSGYKLAIGISFLLDNGVRLWDVTTGSILWARDRCAFGAEPVTWSPDGARFAAAADYTPCVFIVDAVTGAVLHALENEKWVVWSPDGTRIATIRDDAMTVREASTNLPLHTIDGRFPSPRLSSWSPDGTRIATYRYYSARSSWRDVAILDASTGAQLRTLAKPLTFEQQPVWSPDSTRLSVREASRVHIFDAGTGILMRTIDDVSEMAWSPDGGSFATMHRENRGLFKAVWAGRVQIWDAAAGSLQQNLPDTLWVAWSPDGTQLATSGTDSSIRLWQLTG